MNNTRLNSTSLNTNNFRAALDSLGKAVSLLGEVGATPENVELMRVLAAETGEPPEEISRKALALYRKAFEASRKGLTFAFLDDDSNVVEEFVGFGPAEAETPAAR
jgi:hypothetical protein